MDLQFSLVAKVHEILSLAVLVADSDRVSQLAGCLQFVKDATLLKDLGRGSIEVDGRT
jgi:hypothetical protein